MEELTGFIDHFSTEPEWSYDEETNAFSLNFDTNTPIHMRNVSWKYSKAAQVFCFRLDVDEDYFKHITNTAKLLNISLNGNTVSIPVGEHTSTALRTAGMKIADATGAWVLLQQLMFVVPMSLDSDRTFNSIIAWMSSFNTIY